MKSKFLILFLAFIPGLCSGQSILGNWTASEKSGNQEFVLHWEVEAESLTAYATQDGRIIDGTKHNYSWSMSEDVLTMKNKNFPEAAPLVSKIVWKDKDTFHFPYDAPGKDYSLDFKRLDTKGAIKSIINLVKRE